MVGLPPRQGLAPKGQGAGIGVRLLEEPQVRLPLPSALSPTPTLHPALLRPNWALRRWVSTFRSLVAQSRFLPSTNKGLPRWR